MKLYYFILFINLTYFSCGTKNIERKEENIPEIVIENSNRSIKSTSQLFKKFSILKLKNNLNSNIDLIQKVLSVEDKLFLIQYGRGNDEIFCFNTSGDYKFSINTIGQGPMEFTEILDVYFEKEKIALVLIDKKTNKRIYYTLDGKQISEDYDLRGNFFKEVKATDNFYFALNNFYYPEDNYFMIIDGFGKVVDSFIPYHPKFDNMMFGGINQMSVSSKDEINFVAGNRDTIYIYNTKNKFVNKNYIIDFGNNYSLDIDLNSENLLDFLSSNKNYKFSIANLFQNQNYMAFTFVENMSINQAFFNKETYDVILPMALKNDLFNVGLERVLGVTDDGKFIAIFKSDNILLSKGLFQSDSLNIQYGTVPEYFEDPEDPILILLELEF